MMLPITITAMVSHNPSLRTMPSAPSAQFTGAILAPAQIHICCGPVESRSASGIGSMLWASLLSSLFALVMILPLCKARRSTAALPAQLTIVAADHRGGEHGEHAGATKMA